MKYNYIVIDNPEKGMSDKEFDTLYKQSSKKEQKYLSNKELRIRKSTWAFNTLVFQHCCCGHVELLQIQTDALSRHHWVKILFEEGKNRKCTFCTCDMCYLADTEI